MDKIGIFTADAEDEAVELEIQRLTETLADEPRSTGVFARIGKKTAHRVLDSWPLAVALMTTFTILTCLNLADNGLLRPTRPEPSAHDQLKDAERLVRFAAFEGKAYLDRHGRLPSSPTQIGLSVLDDVVFQAAGSTDVIVTVRSGEFEVTYNTRVATPVSREAS